jgi:hypothetical protein
MKRHAHLETNDAANQMANEEAARKRLLKFKSGY